MPTHVIRINRQQNPADSTGSWSPLKAFLIYHAVALLDVVMALVPFLFAGAEKAMGENKAKR